MSIFIKGMEMPKSCAECPVNMNTCKRGYKYLLAHMELYDQRADDCPITTVPAHGRLIDADALKDVQQADADFFKGSSDYGEKCRYDEAINAVANIVNAPTVIQAEEGE